MAYLYKKKKIKEAIERSNGTYTSVARGLGCRSSITARKYVEKFDDLHKRFLEIQTVTCDLAEDVLLSNLESGNDLVRARTCEFILKHLPQSRYKEVDGQDAQTALVNLLEKLIVRAED